MPDSKREFPEYNPGLVPFGRTCSAWFLHSIEYLPVNELQHVPNREMVTLGAINLKEFIGGWNSIAKEHYNYALGSFLDILPLIATNSVW
jgi:hypothetical protein